MSKDKFEWDDTKVKELLRKTTSYVSDEHWNGVVEQFKQEQLSKRDWEIVKWRDVDSGGIYETKIYNRKTEIHSVRRLSDGEVFSVGDYFQVDAYAGDKPFRIKEFRVINNDWIQVQSDSHAVHNWNIDHIKKAELFLFTTDDGVDIFQGVDVWIVRQNFDCNKFAANKWDNCQGQNLHIIRTRSNGCKYFSTKEKAEEYILMNKPMLSVNDVVLAMQDNPTDCRKCGKHVHGTHTKMQLIELAKSKMDKK